MHHRQPLPRLWMMTDERQGDGLFDALRRLPEGSGVVFRHYSLERRDRRALFFRVQAEARRRHLIVLLGEEPQLAEAWGADGSHGLSGGQVSVRGLLRSASVHSLTELKAAERAGADLVFVSPIFPTNSHPGAPALGPVRFALIAREARVPVIALGGMDHARAERLGGINVYGWAAIDAWSAPAG